MVNNKMAIGARDENFHMKKKERNEKKRNSGRDGRKESQEQREAWRHGWQSTTMVFSYVSRRLCCGGVETTNESNKQTNKKARAFRPPTARREAS
jgi:hypothetical protein